MIYLKMNGVTLVWRTCSRLVENHIFFNVDIFIFIYCSSIVTKRQSNPILVMNDNSRKLCITQLDLEEEYRDQRTLFSFRSLNLPRFHLIPLIMSSSRDVFRRLSSALNYVLTSVFMFWILRLCSGSRWEVLRSLRLTSSLEFTFWRTMLWTWTFLFLDWIKI